MKVCKIYWKYTFETTHLFQFMQRADAASPTTPDTPDSPSAKRQKLSNVSSSNTASNETQAVQAATGAEEVKNVEALESQTRDGVETKWILNFDEEVTGTDHRTWRVINASHAELDTGMSSQGYGEEPWRPKSVGRRSFGKFNRALEVCSSYFRTSSESESSNIWIEMLKLMACATQRQNGTAKSSSSDGSQEEEEEARDASENDSKGEISGVRAMIQAVKSEAARKAKLERKAQRREAKAEAVRLAEKRKSKDVKLNKLSSISGGGGGSTGKSDADMICHECGQKGHARKNCPQRERKSKRALGS